MASVINKFFYLIPPRSCLVMDSSRETRVQLYNIISEIEREAPFKALGLFSVDLTTLTSIVSTAMTYIVIMVQFEDSEKASQEYDHSNITSCN